MICVFEVWKMVEMMIVRVYVSREVVEWVYLMVVLFRYGIVIMIFGDK